MIRMELYYNNNTKKIFSLWGNLKGIKIHSRQSNNFNKHLIHKLNTKHKEMIMTKVINLNETKIVKLLLNNFINIL